MKPEKSVNISLGATANPFRGLTFTADLYKIKISDNEENTDPFELKVRDGDRTWAWKVAGPKLQKTALALGERDPRRGDYVVRSGVADGDRLLRHPIGTLRDGQPVQEAPSAPSAAAPASAR